jgi:hypothetical protein
MEVHLTSEQPTRLQQVATRSGKNLEHLICEGLDRMLDYDGNFFAAVEEGQVQACRGDLVGKRPGWEPRKNLQLPSHSADKSV